MTTGKTENEGVLALASAIVAAYVGRHHVRRDELPEVLRSVHATLLKLGTEVPVAGNRSKATPVEIKHSITPDHLVSFEDGKAYVTLRRHLGQRDLTPDQYRTKWGLPVDYPMTAPNYSTRRSEIARTNRFGQRSRIDGTEISADDREPASLAHDPVATSEEERDYVPASGPDEDSFREDDVETITREPYEEDGTVDDE